MTVGWVMVRGKERFSPQSMASKVFWASSASKLTPTLSCLKIFCALSNWAFCTSFSIWVKIFARSRVSGGSCSRRMSNCACAPERVTMSFSPRCAKIWSSMTC